MNKTIRFEIYILNNSMLVAVPHCYFCQTPSVWLLVIVAQWSTKQSLRISLRNDACIRYIHGKGFRLKLRFVVRLAVGNLATNPYRWYCADVLNRPFAKTTFIVFFDFCWTARTSNATHLNLTSHRDTAWSLPAGHRMNRLKPGFSCKAQTDVRWVNWQRGGRGHIEHVL